MGQSVSSSIVMNLVSTKMSSLVSMIFIFDLSFIFSSLDRSESRISHFFAFILPTTHTTHDFGIHVLKTDPS